MSLFERPTRAQLSYTLSLFTSPPIFLSASRAFYRPPARRYLARSRASVALYNVKIFPRRAAPQDGQMNAGRVRRGEDPFIFTTRAKVPEQEEEGRASLGTRINGSLSREFSARGYFWKEEEEARARARDIARVCLRDFRFAQLSAQKERERESREEGRARSIINLLMHFYPSSFERR